MRVISISRRTDIPAFYAAWLHNRLRAGYCHVANPFNGRVSRVSLRPEDCLALVFWTRDPAPLLPYLEAWRADGYRWYAHVTLTAYPSVFEPHSPEVDRAVAAIRRLAEATGPGRVVWRYDPLLLSDRTPPEHHLRQFARLAGLLQGAVRQCVTSFTAGYRKTQRNLARVAAAEGLCLHDPSPEEKRALAGALAGIAAAQGMTLHACCDPGLAAAGLLPARCIDPALLAQLRPEAALALKQAPSRPGCGCAAATDIGAYDTCPCGCVYCYATGDRQRGLQALRAHDPDDTILCRPPSLRGRDFERAAEAF